MIWHLCIRRGADQRHSRSDLHVFTSKQIQDDRFGISVLDGEQIGDNRFGIFVLDGKQIEEADLASLY